MKFKLPKHKKIPELEKDVIDFWESNKIFEKSIEARPEDNLYVFYDGPPFVSGLPHPGHLVVSFAKDVIPRYWAMKGKRVERVWGWDAHGITVESKVQKRLGIKNRQDIVDYGLEEFTKECYAYTSEISSEWEWYIKKIGRWVDMKNAYKTIDQDYMESVIWAFKKLYDEGHIYEGVRTSLFCTTCGTPVSNFEVAMDNTYKDVEDPSVTVAFSIGSFMDIDDVYVLAWTTTPWTLPSNRALVVSEDHTYILVGYQNKHYIVAKDRVENVFEGLEYTPIKEFNGKKLEGLSYTPLYTFFKANEKDFKIYSYQDMVHMNEGTGIVHSAPGFGMVDTDMGRHYGLTMMLTISDTGLFEPGDNSPNPFEGQYYKKANKNILEDVQKRELLFKNEKITHRFPYHDRCNTLLIQKAQDSWFINVADLKSELIKNNEEINWVPKKLKHGRFKKGIEQAPDWCISRNRFWATPMPVWESEDGDRIVIGSVKELEDLSGQKVKDLHRPYIDTIVIKKDGKIFKRREEVLDSWFEAGAMPYSQMHYPFENVQKFEKNFPGDYIVEYIAQTRAWFYVMHVLSTALMGKNSFRNAIGYGVLAGNDGRKMSKTYGNFIDPKKAIETFGGDSMRLYFMGSPLMYGNNANFDEGEFKIKLNSVLNPLWNSLKFFVMYANNSQWTPKMLVDSNDSIDTWIRVRLNETTRDVQDGIESYMLPKSVDAIEAFVDDLSRWYVRRSRSRISSGDAAALSTLYKVLVEFAKVSAPLIPFMAENIYQTLVAGVTPTRHESVHLCDFPSCDKNLIEKNTGMLEKMEKTREAVSLALSLRVQYGIKVRQPLQAVYIDTGSVEEFLDDLIKAEVNVKEVKYVNNLDSSSDNVLKTSNLKVQLDLELNDELKLEGHYRELVRRVQDMRKKEGLTVDEVINVTVPSDSLTKEVIKVYASKIQKKVSAKEITYGAEYEINVL